MGARPLVLARAAPKAALAADTAVPAISPPFPRPVVRPLPVWAQTHSAEVIVASVVVRLALSLVVAAVAVALLVLLAMEIMGLMASPRVLPVMAGLAALVTLVLVERLALEALQQLLMEALAERRKTGVVVAVARTTVWVLLLAATAVLPGPEAGDQTIRAQAAQAARGKFDSPGPQPVAADRQLHR